MEETRMKYSEDISITNWCDEQAEHGKLTAGWDGGNDSGSYFIRLDGEELAYLWSENTDENPPPSQKLVNMLAAVSEYGSFAGDFSTDCELTYDPELKAFTGTDVYSETEDADKQGIITFKVRKDLWFDQVELTWNGNSDGPDECSADLTMLNGPEVSEHETEGKEIANQIHKQLEDFFDEKDNVDSYSEWGKVISRSELVEEGDYLVGTITSIGYARYKNEDKEIYIQLKNHNQKIETDETD